MSTKNNNIWMAIMCKICGKKASWSNEATGNYYCGQCMEDVAFR